MSEPEKGMAKVIPFRAKSRPNNYGETLPKDEAILCDFCGGISWALRRDGEIECLGCQVVLDYASWGGIEYE